MALIHTDFLIRDENEEFYIFLCEILPGNADEHDAYLNKSLTKIYACKESKGFTPWN